MTATSTSTHTRTQTATHLSDVVMATMRDVLAHLGIDATRLLRNWDRDQKAIAAWIYEGSLKHVVLECHQPSGAVAPVLEFPVSYTSANVGDQAFVTSQARIVSYLAKIANVPAGSTYKLFCEFNGPRTPQDGWSPGTRASMNDLRGRTIGTVASAPHASTSARIYTR